MQNENESTTYGRYFLMIAISMVAMFFLMYTHSYQVIDHYWFSETRLFMTLIMGGAMLVLMLVFMRSMYTNRAANAAIYVLGVVCIAGGIYLVRSQVTVSGVDYMQGMIPHHSIAILTSERAHIKDLRVRELADGIIRAQRREIMEMEWLIEDIRKNGAVETQAQLEQRPLPHFSGSLDTPTKEFPH